MNLHTLRFNEEKGSLRKQFVKEQYETLMNTHMHNIGDLRSKLQKQRWIRGWMLKQRQNIEEGCYYLYIISREEGLKGA